MIDSPTQDTLSNLFAALDQLPQNDSQISAAIGKSPGFISDARRKRSDIKLSTICALMYEFNLEPTQIFTGKGILRLVTKAAGTVLDFDDDEIRNQVSIDEMLYAWRSSKGQLSDFDSRLLSYCLIYRESESDKLAVEMVGHNSIAAAIMGDASVGGLQAILDETPNEFRNIILSSNRIATPDGFDFSMQTTDLSFHGVNNVMCSYDRLVMPIFGDDGTKLLIVYSRMISAQPAGLGPA